jgi:translocation and assembly module TamB
MAEDNKYRRSHVGWWIAATGLLVLVVLLLAFWYAGSPQFQDLVRSKLVASLEDATGGRVDLGSFRWNLSRLEFQAQDLTIHGLEPSGEAPYVHADQVQVRLRIVSFLERQVHLQSLTVQRPVVHIIVNPDGSTNIPAPRQTSDRTAVQQLFDLAVSHLDVQDGTLFLNQRKLPLDFSASDVAVSLAYARAEQRFDGTVHAGKIDIKYQDFRDVAAHGDMNFSLWPNRAELKTLKLVSGKSTLDASARINAFNSPQVQVTYSSSLDAAQLGAITRSYQLRGGTILLTGTGTFSQAAGYHSRGRTAIRGLNYENDGLNLRNATLESDFLLDNDHLSIRRLAARLLGGEVRGGADVKNLWSTAITASSQPAPAATPKANRNRKSPAADTAGNQQQGTAHLQVSGFSLAELARMFSTRAIPYDSLHAVGSTAGSIDLTWRGSLAALEAGLDLQVTAPPQVSDGELPVNANIKGRYSARSQLLALAELDLNTRHTRLKASGTLGQVRAALQLTASTTSLKELQPFLSAIGSGPIPVDLEGEASFHGTLTGRLRAPEVAGHLQASNFTYLYSPKLKRVVQPPPQLPAKMKSFFQRSAAPPQQVFEPTGQLRRIHIDQFAGDVRYSPSELELHHGMIQRGSAHATVDLSATLSNGNITDTSPLQLQLSVQNADVAQLKNAAGFDYPMSGTLNLVAQVSGTQRNPNGSGHFTFTGGEIYGRPVKSLSANLSFANQSAQFKDIHLQALRGTVAGSAAYNWSTKAVQIDLSGDSIDLREIPELQTRRLALTGIAHFTAKGSGTVEQPLVNAHVAVVDMTLNGDPVGSLAADAVTHGTHLQLTAQSAFKQASLSVNGGIELRGEMPADLKLVFSGIDVNPFLPEQMRRRITRHSSLEGHAQLTGPLRQPRLLNGVLSIHQFAIEVERVAIASDGPLELALANQELRVQRCSLVSEDSHFTLNGAASMKGDRPLNLRANGHVNLKLAHTLDPELTTYGISDIDVTVVGPMTHPAMSGRIDIAHAGLSMIELPAGLGDVNGSLVFNQDRLEVEHLTARTGGGLVTVGGFVTYQRTIGFNLTANGNEIRFRYAGISVTADASMRLLGTLDNATLSGDVTVTRFAQIPSSDLQFVVAQASAPPQLPNPNSPLNHLRLDVRILSSPELTVQTTLAKLSGDVDLRLRGSAERPVLLGRINIAEGDIKISGTKYHMERGDITFTDPVRIDPVLDVEATTRVRDYDITIGLHGTLERLNTTYRSDPPLSSDDIVALLAFGRTQQESALNSVPSSGFAESASGAMLGQAINQTLGNRVTRLFGVSAIRINPSIGGPDNNPNARLTVEQQVSNNVTVTYITNLTQSAQQVIQFEYNINSEYTVQGIRDENGVVSFDLLIRKRKR